LGHATISKVGPQNVWGHNSATIRAVMSSGSSIWN
jgi:hypothetical protein